MVDARVAYRRLLYDHVQELRKVEARLGGPDRLDPTDPTASMLASEKRGYAKRSAALTDLQAQLPEPVAAREALARILLREAKNS